VIDKSTAFIFKACVKQVATRYDIGKAISVNIPRSVYRNTEESACLSTTGPPRWRCPENSRELLTDGNR
jgi:hypothetical protein